MSEAKAQGIVDVVGKGRRPRSAPLGDRAATALERYLRLRARHPRADLPWLWIGRLGRVTDSGLSQIVARRPQMAGIEGRVHCHQFRHTFADNCLRNDGGENARMVLLGWSRGSTCTRCAPPLRSRRRF
jgi:site-specific recombinase XerD